jgi:hypothetical protein
MQRFNIDEMKLRADGVRHAVADCDRYIRDSATTLQEGVEYHWALGDLFGSFIEGWLEEDNMIELPPDINEVLLDARVMLRAIVVEIRRRADL